MLEGAGVRQGLRRAIAHGQRGATGPSAPPTARVVPPSSLPPVSCDPAELRRIARGNQRANRGQPPVLRWRRHPLDDPHRTGA
jgi:hypothetical protein